LIIGLSLAEALADTGDTAGASAMVAEAAPFIDAMKKPGAPHGVIARTRAVILLKQGRAAEARAELLRAEAIFRTLGSQGEAYLRAFPALKARIPPA
jgi:non-specific serine/threonine protein kinase/serine/threonine-protein kinase